MRFVVTALWLVSAVLIARDAKAQTSHVSPSDLARIARVCQSSTADPFRSTADIQREVACNAAAIEMLRGAPPAAQSLTLSITAKLGKWDYRYNLDSATDLNANCLVFGLLTLPAGRNVALNITSEDTIHTFLLPTLGVKATAIPGRIETKMVRTEAVGKIAGTAVTAEGTTRENKAAVNVRFLDEKDYVRWEHETLRARGCGLAR
jgi:heme/copper-type cytochrome/quinol oxidase subunit 2